MKVRWPKARWSRFPLPISNMRPYAHRLEVGLYMLVCAVFMKHAKNKCKCTLINCHCATQSTVSPCRSRGDPGRRIHQTSELRRFSADQSISSCTSNWLKSSCCAQLSWRRCPRPIAKPCTLSCDFSSLGFDNLCHSRIHPHIGIFYQPPCRTYDTIDATYVYGWMHKA